MTIVERRIHGRTLQCVLGDITEQPDLDAIVNAANAELLAGGGVCGAIHRAAGPELEKACRPLAPLRPGEAVISGAFGLPNRFVIHCLGPVYRRDEPADQLLASCYRNALQLAARRGVRAIGFPAISTGIFGYPVDLAAAVALQAVGGELPHLASLQLVRFVLFSAGDLDVHTAALDELVAGVE